MSTPTPPPALFLRFPYGHLAVWSGLQAVLRAEVFHRHIGPGDDTARTAGQR